jgi:hypothetical protein
MDYIIAVIFLKEKKDGLNIYFTEKIKGAPVSFNPRCLMDIGWPV